MNMGFCSDSDEEDLYFDTQEDLLSISDSGSDSADVSDPNLRFLNWVSVNSDSYEVWVHNPESVHERRSKFLELMGLNLGETLMREPGQISIDIDRIIEMSGAMSRNTSFKAGSTSGQCSEHPALLGDSVSEENFQFRFRNLDNGTEFIVDELGQDGNFSRLREVGSNRMYTFDEFQLTVGLSPFVHRLMQRDLSRDSNLNGPIKGRKSGWLRRLGAVASVVGRQRKQQRLKSSNSNLRTSDRPCRVRVPSYKKDFKEISALYRGQEIEAHLGPIFSMKFSLDGKYLASAGADEVVRVWQVLECTRTDEDHSLATDPTCLYFTVDHSSEISPLIVCKEKLGKIKNLKRNSESPCVILPHKVFRLSENPLHEFRGHSGDVLDLAWSESKFLLSSSVDKTVRLWQVGCGQCLKVFSHNNYVTCVQFNPVDENYFVSGSIDGKVRIWSILGCQVVDWTDIRAIVTAVCYSPDGQGVIVGSMTGNCCFYDASGNHLQIDARISLQGKKKSLCKRITGFQFSTSDSRKLMVTSADSQVRILDGADVVCKYRGLRNAGSQISASFTSDGKHIISASEDSKVYIWNNSCPDGPTSVQAKSVRSCEHFFSSNASIALPWPGIKSENANFFTSETLEAHHQHFNDLAGNSCHCRLDSSARPTEWFSLSHELFSEILPRGSATWPEEKLPTSSSPTVSPAICKSHYKFLKASCLNTVTSPHAWGLVIVTAGWDGRIRSFLNYGLPVCI